VAGDVWDDLPLVFSTLPQGQFLWIDRHLFMIKLLRKIYTNMFVSTYGQFCEVH